MKEWAPFLTEVIKTVLFAALYVATLVFAYRDSKRRNAHAILIVLLVALVAWPLGLLLWLAFRPKQVAFEPGQPKNTRSYFGFGFLATSGIYSVLATASLFTLAAFDYFEAALISFFTIMLVPIVLWPRLSRNNRK